MGCGRRDLERARERDRVNNQFHLTEEKTNSKPIAFYLRNASYFLHHFSQNLLGGDMKSKLATIFAVALFSLATLAFSQDAMHDVDKAAKDAGHDTKVAAKDTAKGTEKAADKTADATKHAAKKTGHGVKTAAKDTGKGVDKAADKTADAVK
jgi:hypothetical protein